MTEESTAGVGVAAVDTAAAEMSGADMARVGMARAGKAGVDMMKSLTLAFDTASDDLAIAIGLSDEQGHVKLVASDDHHAKRQANVSLLPSIDTLMKAQGFAQTDIKQVVCGLGPGSFTGVRIAVATAKGIAMGLGVPLFGVSTLDAVAWGAWLAGF